MRGLSISRPWFAINPTAGGKPNRAMSRSDRPVTIETSVSSRSQQAAIDRYFQAELAALGSDFPYAELFDVVEG